VVLLLVLQVYAKPLKEFAKAGKEVIDVQSVRCIFSDVEMLLSFNSQLLADLTTATATDGPLGDIFLRVVSVYLLPTPCWLLLLLLLTKFILRFLLQGTGLKLYTSYINNYGAAQQELKKQQTSNSAFRVWLEVRLPLGLLVCLLWSFVFLLAKLGITT
jgi:hypothetical protein